MIKKLSFIKEVLAEFKNRDDWKLVLGSAFFIFSLFASYSILRPIRDALGLQGGSSNLKTLFLIGFIATLLCSLLAISLSGKVSKKNYIRSIFLFFTVNLLLFYIAIKLIPAETTAFLWLSRVFYIWVGVFNLFVLSSAWSLIADLFTKEGSKKAFGIIAAGVSLGGVFGSSLVAWFKFADIANFIFISMTLLLFAMIIQLYLMKESIKIFPELPANRFNLSLQSKNPFVGIKLIIKSKYLLYLVVFIFLLTSVSTFLYMEQARVMEVYYPKSLAGYRELRSAMFAKVDFIVQFFSLISQVFFTSYIVKKFGLKWLLSIVGFTIGFGFLILSFTHPLFLPVIIVMIVRRVGEYALVKPGREMLFVALKPEEKYQAKNFMDTVVYRGGDVISSQIEGFLRTINPTVSLIFAAFVAFAWGAVGYILGRNKRNN